MTYAPQEVQVVLIRFTFSQNYWVCYVANYCGPPNESSIWRVIWYEFQCVSFLLVCTFSTYSVRKAMTMHLTPWSAQGTSLMFFRYLVWYTVTKNSTIIYVSVALRMVTLKTRVYLNATLCHNFTGIGKNFLIFEILNKRTFIFFFNWIVYDYL